MADSRHHWMPTLLMLMLLALGGLAGCSNEPAATAQSADEPTAEPPNSDPAAPEPPAELDLSIDRDALWAADQNRDAVDTSERQDLPNLVGADGDKRVTIDGRVLTRDEVHRLRDRVDGAEVSIELKTD